MKKILFIAHDTSRTGAPKVLLYFLEWLAKNDPEIEISLLALRGGQLEEDFKATVHCYYKLSDYEPVALTFFQEFKKRLLKRTGLRKKKISAEELLLQELAFQNFDLIYANTVVSLSISFKIKAFNKRLKILNHVHELEVAIQLMVPDSRNFLGDADYYIAASELVKDNLEKKYSIPSSKIETIYEFTKIKENLKKASDECFLVGGAGVAGLRKGSDLFIQVAKYIKNHYPDLKIKFTWVGDVPHWERLILENDLKKAGLNESVSFTGDLEIPETIFSKMDVFLMTSREDPFPLVCIELGMLGKPIIGFKNATGTEEVIKNGGGEFVPYLDVGAMAEEVIKYYHDHEKLAKDSAIAKDIFSKYTPEIIAPKILEVIKKVL